MKHQSIECLIEDVDRDQRNQNVGWGGMSRQPGMSVRAEHSNLAKETERESRMAVGEMQGNMDKAGIREERFGLPTEGWGNGS